MVFVRGPSGGSRKEGRRGYDEGADEMDGRDDKERAPYHLLAWGWNWICHVDVAPPPPSSSPAHIQHRDSHTTSSFKAIMTYRQMLHVGDLSGGGDGEGEDGDGAGEILVVERPLTDVLMGEGVPPPFYKPKYGRS